MRDVILAYQQAVTGVINGFGGHVDKYMGDGVLADFGSPSPMRTRPNAPCVPGWPSSRPCAAIAPAIWKTPSRFTTTSRWRPGIQHRPGRLGKSLFALGRFSAAESLVQQIDRCIDEGGEEWFWPELRRLEGDVYRVHGDSNAAAKCYRKAIAIAVEGQAKGFELRTATRLATLLAEQGDIATPRGRPWSRCMLGSLRGSIPAI